MMSRLEYANLYLTRKCEGSSEIFRVFGGVNYLFKPNSYPTTNDFEKTTKDYNYWIKVIDSLCHNNKDIVINFLGGDSFLFPQFEEIVKYINEKNVNYNITLPFPLYLESERRIRDIAYTNNPYTSIGCYIIPGFDKVQEIDDDIKRSQIGFEGLKLLKELGLSKRIFGKVVCTKTNLKHLNDCCSLLSSNGFDIELLLMDNVGGNFYDFFEKNGKLALDSSSFINNTLIKINNRYNIYTDNEFDNVINNIGTFKCNLSGKNFRGISVDVDGKMRLCDRIRGEYSSEFEIIDIINTNGDLSGDFISFSDARVGDFDSVCRGCSNCDVMVDSI